jgi:hypothetical protein
MTMNNKQTADLILYGNYIFTSTNDVTMEGFIAIKGNKIIAVQGMENMEHYVSKDTKLIDCKDKLIMPGFHDSHTHLLMAILFDNAVDLYNAKSEEEAVKAVVEYAKTQPNDGSLIVGFNWNSSVWPTQYPTKTSIDKVISDRPVLLAKMEGHGAWLNSMALDLFGIVSLPDNIEGGEVQKDANGDPTGYLDEKAVLMLYDTASSILFSTDEIVEMKFKKAFAELSQNGITAISDLYWSYEPVIKVLSNLEAKNELDVRFNFALFPTPFNESEIAEYQMKYQSDKLHYQGVKYLYDGTILGYTADLLEPYSDYPETTNILPMDFEAFQKEILEQDAKGRRVRIHAIGDGAVTKALDIFEKCQKVNGKRDSRHSIAHVEVLDPRNIKRFKDLDVIADVHPAHIPLASEKWEDNSYMQRLGAREKLCFNYKALSDGGVQIAMGSDFPIVPCNPMLGVYRGTTRRFDDGLPVDGWVPDQRLPVSKILKFFTAGSAYHDFSEDKIGTIEEGKLADIIVIDRNLLTVPVEQIRSAEVLMTVCDGKIVYQK